MPVLHQYADGSGHYVKSHINGAIVTFQLLGAGASRLQDAGFDTGDVFPLRLLGELCHAGEAFTGKRGGADYFEAEQFEFFFADDLEAVALKTTRPMAGLRDGTAVA